MMRNSLGAPQHKVQLAGRRLIQGERMFICAGSLIGIYVT